MEVNEIEKAELLPCPFCGGEAKIEQNAKNGYKLKCTSCVVAFTSKTIHHSLDWLRAKMIENWNKRQQSLPDKSDGEVLYRDAAEKLKSISDSRYSIPMPFNWDMLYKAMEEYKSQSTDGDKLQKELEEAKKGFAELGLHTYDDIKAVLQSLQTKD